MRTLLWCSAAVVFVFLVPPARADHWIEPTAEELSMTSQAGAPNAAAIILSRDEIADDSRRMHSEHVRIKILTEEGKRYADIELGYLGNYFCITDVAGRTIHPDGTVIPFTGKPYDKTVVKTKNYFYKSKVFTMPDAQVGSIIEYSYKLGYKTQYFVPPRWYIQSALYLRRGHYHFTPTTEPMLVAHGDLARQVSFYRSLPAGAAVTHGLDGYDLVVKDVPPVANEAYLPPVQSLSYRVLFFYTPYHGRDEFWHEEGKYWSRESNDFANAGALRGIAGELTDGAGTPEQRLRKLYAAVQSLDNTDYTHVEEQDENTAAGQKRVRTALDVWDKQRGTSDELAMLFIGLARAAGFNAYRMTVVNRDKNLLNPEFTDLSQLDDDIAIVVVDGREVFFDPGEKYCPYGQLSWKHALARGLRQFANGKTGFGESAGMGYKENVTTRVAQLAVAEDGSVSGPLQLSFTGSDALVQRQSTLDRSPDERKKHFEEVLRRLLPAGMEIRLVQVANLDNLDKPFVLDYMVSGPVGTASARRLLLPQGLFEVNETQPFTAATRSNMVYFDFPFQHRDMVEFTFPPNMKVDSLPKDDALSLKGFGIYATLNNAEGNRLTLQRELIVADNLQMAREYPGLKSFFGSVRSRDEDQALVSRVASAKGN